jgi:hypothetical protein
MVLIAFGPAIIMLGSQEVAEALGCEVDLNRAIPCVIHGTATPSIISASASGIRTSRSQSAACCS